MNFLDTNHGRKLLKQYLKKIKSEASQRVYRSAITRFFAFHDGDIDTLLQSVLEGYRDLLAEKCSPLTAKREFSILNNFFKFIAKSRVSKEFQNPIIHLKDYSIGNYGASPEFKSLMDSFLEHLPAEKTKAAYRLQLTAFFAWINKAVQEVKPEDLKAYRDYLTAQGIKASTFWAKFIPINRLYKFLAIKKGLTNPVNFFDIRLPLPKKRKGFYTVISKEDAIKLLNQPDTTQLIGKRDYTIILMILVFGLRINEVTKITYPYNDSFSFLFL